MTTHSAAAAAKLTSGLQQLLTFVLGGETYGVDILRVQEMRGWSSVTQVPHSPTHVLGVLNLRGSVVPIVDLRKYFDLKQVEYSAVTVIIVLSVQDGDGRRDVGIVVDGVSEVVDVKTAAVQPPPDLGSSAATDHIRGILPVSELMIVLLDVDRLVEATLSSAQLNSRKPSQAAGAAHAR